MTTSIFNDPKKIDSALTNFNRKLEEEEAVKRAQVAGLPYINLHNFPIDLNILGLMSENDARQSESLIFYKDKNDLRIACLNPKNPLLQEMLQHWQEKNTVSLYVISKSNFESVMRFYQKVINKVESRDETIRILSGSSQRDFLKTISDFQTQQTLTHTQLLTCIFGSAVFLGASDIHLEPEAEFVKVRFRLDGVLQELLRLEKSLQKPLTSRVKIQSKLKLNVETIPQDGRLTFIYEQKPIDVRVSTLPSAFGESIVMRLLNASNLVVDFNDLGFMGKARDIVSEQLKKPNGMIITTGPTGSGKTTTLYTFLKELNEPGVKIITIEDPVEYKLEGITQTPIDHNADFSFDKALKAILRQDPDIVMVGEIRDGETANTAAQAALTGHVVLSTLHTNDASGAIPRLYNMGVKPFVLGPALNCIIAQRLVRKLCQSCKIQDTPTPEMLERVKLQLGRLPKNSKLELPQELVFYKSQGCPDCHSLGYRGRVGIFEVIEITEDLEKLILKEPSMSEIRQLATENGTLSLLQDGLVKALAGITDLAEIYRVAGD